MKIALILESPYSMGRWRRFDLMYKHLKGLGNDVNIIAFSGKETGQEDVIDVCVSIPFRMIGTFFHFLSFKWFSNVSYLIKACLEVRRFKPDVVVFQWYDLGLFLLVFK